MTKIKKDLPPLNEIIFQAQENNEPSFTNSISPNNNNNRQRNSTCSYIISDSEGSPHSCTSYSSDYSSLGNVLNHTDFIGKKIFIKQPNNSNNNEFNFGHGLLSQVHKMQSLLEEYQNSLTAMEIEKADYQQEINKLEKRLKAKGETEEKYKEDIWNLELKNQELYQRINEISQELSKSHIEQTKILREESVLSQELDHLKALQLSWQQTLKDTQESFESEIISYKKTLQSNRLEKENLLKQINDLVSTTTATTNATTVLRHVIEPNKLTDEEEDDDRTVTVALSQPILSNNNNQIKHTTQLEIDALKSSLNQAHEIIHTMQEKIDYERNERIEVDKLLREAQETIENYSQHITSPSMMYSPYDNKKSILVGKSLGDELAGSLTELIPINTIDYHQQEKRQRLSLINLPSLSNINLSPQQQYDQEIIKTTLYATNNDQHYGSLLKKPESYFYKSSTKIDDETRKDMTPSIVFASQTADSILNTNVDIFSNIIKSTVDDTFITALTRTMMGDWMWKYKRKVVGKGISENRHRRFFWFHPYTQTIYWASKKPGTSIGTSNTKSALVESFILLPHEKSKTSSILIQTPLRGLKVECMDRPSHSAWIKSLEFILAQRNNGRLSQLATSVSKRHYFDRKKSRQEKEAITENDAPSTSTVFYTNSTLVDVSSSSNT